MAFQCDSHHYDAKSLKGGHTDVINCCKIIII
jgi:hypothetical protein